MQISSAFWWDTNWSDLMDKARESSLLPRFSVNRPVTVVVIFIAMLVVGYIAYSKIPLEMMPTASILLSW